MQTFFFPINKVFGQLWFNCFHFIKRWHQLGLLLKLVMHLLIAIYFAWSLIWTVDTGSPESYIFPVHLPIKAMWHFLPCACFVFGIFSIADFSVLQQQTLVLQHNSRYILFSQSLAFLISTEKEKKLLIKSPSWMDNKNDVAKFL